MGLIGEVTEMGIQPVTNEIILDKVNSSQLAKMKK